MFCKLCLHPERSPSLLSAAEYYNKIEQYLIYIYIL